MALTLKETAHIDRGMKLLHEEADIEVAKKYSCAFYKGGNHPSCSFCKQPDEKVLECVEDWQTQMQTKPAMEWSPELDQLEKRDKTKLSEVSIGQHCDTCYLSDKCAMFKAKALCAIEWTPDLDFSNGKAVMDFMIKLQGERIQRAQMIELTDGGVPDMTLSGEMDRMTGLLESRANIGQDRVSINIEGSGKGVGALSAIFGPKKVENALPEKTTETLEIPHIEVKEEVVAKKKTNGKKKL